MSSFSRVIIAFKALLQLGIKQTGLYGLYQLGIRTGHYRRSLNAALTRLEKMNQPPNLELHTCLGMLPEPQDMLKLLGQGVNDLYIEADEITQGKVRLFGSQPVQLLLTSPGELADWTAYELGNDMIDGKDIKFIWEPARMGWACKLAMAYHLSKEERYAETFWRLFEEFITANPPFQGHHWSSAQEAAIRLLALAFAMQVFSSSSQSTPERIGSVAKTIAIHAERIPPTIVYARSQNNNHLVTEALGLYTASAVLPCHPFASKWHELGKNWLEHALITQIDPNGTYTQLSTNYHRLMLQCALWAVAVQNHAFKNEPFPTEVMSRLEAATRWLWKLVDPAAGHVPNLGHNDGSYILPLSICPYDDYRPVLFAACRAFLHTQLLPHGPWEDMAAWLSLPGGPTKIAADLDYWHKNQESERKSQHPYILLNPNSASWAAFHVTQFNARPAHADQLHLDLWWRGFNLAQDAGTYLYNAPAPWDNTLTSAFVHNTVTIDQREFMHKASRFLYLDWAHGEIVDMQASDSGGWVRLTARHDGYRKLGLTHTRTVTACEDGRWEVMDIIEGKTHRPHTARLYWLLPDWNYEIHEPPFSNGFAAREISLHSPHGIVKLSMGVITQAAPESGTMSFQLARAGKLLMCTGSVPPNVGWTSPTYGDKMPALACIIEITQELPIKLKSEWTLPLENDPTGNPTAVGE